MTAFEKVKTTLLQHQYTWLITGVAGFIGSNLLEALLKLNQKVVGLDNFSTGFERNLETVLSLVSSSQQSNFTFLKGDIRDMEACKKALEGVDFVLHEAALGSVPRSIKTPELTDAVNVLGFVNMLKASVDEGVKRFVYASSSSVYGDSKTLPKVEANIGHQLSPYAVSKYTNELYAGVFAKSYGLETIGLRYFNVFGPRQDPNGAYAAVMPLWFKAFLKGERPCIYGDGGTSRDFCFVQNVVQANILSAMTQNEEAVNQVYNVAVSDRTTLNELFYLIRDTLGVENIEPDYRPFRAGDIRHSLADISKAKAFLGFEPQYTVKEGLILAKQYYQDLVY